MFIPIGDEPNPPQTPWGTYALMAANVAIWILVCLPAQHVPLLLSDPDAIAYLDATAKMTGHPRLEILGHASAYDLMMFRYGFRPNAPSIVSLFASLFLHGGWMHLFGNMLFLYIFGDNVEARLGVRRYLLMYLATGVAATVFYAIARFGSGMPLIGASGAISGVLGCYFVWFPHNRVRVLITLFVFFERILVPARWVLGFYLLIENLLPFLLDKPGHSATAYGAHLGGFFAGAAFASMYARGWLDPVGAGKSAAPPGDHGGAAFAGGAYADGFEHAAQRDGFASAPGSATVLRLIDMRRFAEAMAHFRGLPAAERTRLPAEAMFSLADYLTQQKTYEEAIGLLRQKCTAQHAALDRARAHLRIGLIYLHGLQRPVAAYQHLLDVLDAQPEGQVADAAREVLTHIERAEGGASR